MVGSGPSGGGSSPPFLTMFVPWYIYTLPDLEVVKEFTIAIVIAASVVFFVRFLGMIKEDFSKPLPLPPDSEDE